MSSFPSVDESFDRLHRAGWSVGEVVTASGLSGLRHPGILLTTSPCGRKTKLHISRRPPTHRQPVSPPHSGGPGADPGRGDRLFDGQSHEEAIRIAYRDYETVE
jgi:hypothetical protein